MGISELTAEIMMPVLKYKQNPKNPLKASRVFNNLLQNRKVAFQRLVLLGFTDIEFMQYVLNLRKKWSIRIDGRNKKLESSVVDRFLESKTEQEQGGFQSDIDNMLNDFNFGIEWKDAFIEHVVADRFEPPIYNCSIKVIDRGKRKRIIIEANEFTTEEDIKAIIPKFLMLKNATFKVKLPKSFVAKTLLRDIEIYRKKLINKNRHIIQDLLFETEKLPLEKLGETDKKNKEVIKKAYKRIKKRLFIEKVLRK